MTHVRFLGNASSYRTMRCKGLAQPREQERNRNQHNADNHGKRNRKRRAFRIRSIEQIIGNQPQRIEQDGSPKAMSRTPNGGARTALRCSNGEYLQGTSLRRRFALWLAQPYITNLSGDMTHTIRFQIIVPTRQRIVGARQKSPQDSMHDPITSRCKKARPPKRSGIQISCKGRC